MEVTTKISRDSCRQLSRWGVWLLVLGLGACDKSAKPGSASASVSASAASSGSPAGSSKYESVAPKRRDVEAKLNPRGRAAYSGPTGTVRGVVRVKGVPPEVSESVLKKIPAHCKAARAMYGPRFRVGADGALADALVSVTGYKAYLPPRGEAVPVKAKQCAWDRRTYAMSLGQRLEVTNQDGETYIPRLFPGVRGAMPVALPGGGAIKVFPQKIGRFVLEDGGHPYNLASVFVLKYPTFDVTGVDGRFEVTGLPPGKLNVSAMLPVSQEVATKPVEVSAGATTEVELVIEYRGRRAPGPAGSAGARPAPSTAR